MMLNRGNTALVVVDIQGNLFLAMHDRQALCDNARKLLQGFALLEVPIVATEQNKLGETVPELAAAIPGFSPFPKDSFSCCGAPGFRERLAQLARREIVLTGIEAHVCVYQTALDLLAEGYGVTVVADAVSSRTARNHALGLDKMAAAGVKISGTETVLFELLRTATDPKARDIFRLVK